MTENQVASILDEIKDNGSKNVTLNVANEPTVAPTFKFAVERLKANGLVGTFNTNGLKLNDEFVKVKQIGDATFVNARTAEIENTVDNNFFYDTKRLNSSVVKVSNTSITMDDNPPY